MICIADLSETIETHNFTRPSSIGLKTDRVSLNTTNSWNWFKVGSVSSKMPSINRHPKHHSIEMNHILYSDIFPLHSTKLFILKTILSILIWTFSHSYEIVHVYPTCMKKSVNNSRKHFLHTGLQPMGPIIMIWYIRNFQIIYDRLRFFLTTPSSSLLSYS